MIPSTGIIVNGKRMSRWRSAHTCTVERTPGICRSLLDGFFSGGGNVIDTGRVYHGGGSEYVIGEWLRDNGMSGKAIVITKGGSARIPDGTHIDPPGSRVNAKCIEEDIKTSLDLRRIMRICDIYFVHKDNPEITGRRDHRGSEQVHKERFTEAHRRVELDLRENIRGERLRGGARVTAV